MQCQSQLNAPRSLNALNFKAAIQMRNTAWFGKLHTVNSDEECMEAFDDIDNMTIERFYDNYINSNGSPQHRIVVLGPWSVDIKIKLKFLTNEPGNMTMYGTVIRG